MEILSVCCCCICSRTFRVGIKYLNIFLMIFWVDVVVNIFLLMCYQRIMLESEIKWYIYFKKLCVILVFHGNYILIAVLKFGKPRKQFSSKLLSISAKLQCKENIETGRSLRVLEEGLHARCIYLNYLQTFD